MKNEKLKVEQLIMGAFLLDFDKVNSVDVLILVEMFLRYNLNYEIDELELSTLDSYVELKDNFNFNSDLKKTFEQYVSSDVMNFLKQLDMNEFVLRKLKHYYLEDHYIKEDDVNKFFCKKQLAIVDELEKQGVIFKTWHSFEIYNDFRIILLSHEVYINLFKIDYGRELETFIGVLKKRGYDINILDDFLLYQDLEKSVWDVLDISKFEQYCDIFDRSLYSPESYKYEKIKKN